MNNDLEKLFGEDDSPACGRHKPVMCPETSASNSHGKGKTVEELFSSDDSRPLVEQTVRHTHDFDLEEIQKTYENSVSNARRQEELKVALNQEIEKRRAIQEELSSVNTFQKVSYLQKEDPAIFWETLCQDSFWNTATGKKLQSHLSVTVDKESETGGGCNEKESSLKENPDENDLFSDDFFNFDLDDSDLDEKNLEEHSRLDFIDKPEECKADFWLCDGDGELLSACRMLGWNKAETLIPRDKVAFLFCLEEECQSKPLVYILDEKECRNCNEDDVSDELNSQGEFRVIILPSSRLPEGRKVLLCRFDSRHRRMAEGTLDCRRFYNSFACTDSRHVYFMAPEAALHSDSTEWFDKLACGGRFHIVLGDASNMNGMPTDINSKAYGALLNFAKCKKTFYPSAWRYAIVQRKAVEDSFLSVALKTSDALADILLSREDEHIKGFLRSCSIPELFLQQECDADESIRACSSEATRTAVKMCLAKAYYRMLEKLMDSFADGTFIYSPSLIDDFHDWDDLYKQLVSILKGDMVLASNDKWSALIAVLRYISCSRCACDIRTSIRSSMNKLMKHIATSSASNERWQIILYRNASNFVKISDIADEPLKRLECDRKWLEQKFEKHLSGIEKVVDECLAQNGSVDIGEDEVFYAAVKMFTDRDCLFFIAGDQVFHDSAMGILHELREVVFDAEVSKGTVERIKIAEEIVNCRNDRFCRFEERLKSFEGHPFFRMFPLAADCLEIFSMSLNNEDEIMEIIN